jgi:hypothetical protein
MNAAVVMFSPLIIPKGAWSLGLGNLELGIERLQNIQTTAYECTHKALAHLFLAHEGPNPLCTVVVIATT